MNDAHGIFVRPTAWRGEEVLRLSFISPTTSMDAVAHLVDAIARAAESMR